MNSTAHSARLNRVTLAITLLLGIGIGLSLGISIGFSMKTAKAPGIEPQPIEVAQAPQEETAPAPAEPEAPAPESAPAPEPVAPPTEPLDAPETPAETPQEEPAAVPAVTTESAPAELPEAKTATEAPVAAEAEAESTSLPPVPEAPAVAEQTPEKTGEAPAGTARGELWAARHLFMAVEGTVLTDEARALIGRIRPGGVILRDQNIENRAQTIALVSAIKAAAGMGDAISDLPLIAVSQDGGNQNPLRLRQAPSLEELGKGRDLTLAKEAGQNYATACTSRGIGVLLAPGLDLALNDLPAGWASRSFGSERNLVAAMGLAMADGVMRTGILAVAKHFPGHGGTDRDSAEGTATLTSAVPELANIMYPFTEAAARDIPGILVGHITVREIDYQRPASLSPVLVQQLLRERWGYEGVTLCDDLTLKAITDNYAIEEAAVLALQAGNDALILNTADAQTIGSVLAAIEDAVRAGKLSPEQLSASVGRLDAWQDWLRKPRALKGPLPGIEAVAAPLVPSDTAEPAATAPAVDTADTAPAPPAEAVAPAEQPSAPPEAAEPKAEAISPAEETPVPAEEASVPIEEATAPAEETPAPAAPPETPAVVEPSVAPEEAPAAESAAPEEPSVEAPSEPSEAPTPVPAEEAPASEETAPAEEVPPSADAEGMVEINHMIKKGETLSSLASKYGVSTQDILAWNNLTDPKIQYGRKVTIRVRKEVADELAKEAETAPAPAPQPPGTKVVIHEVQPGDMVGRIAERYGVRSKDILEWNALSDPNIRVGQRLTLYVPE